MTIVVDPTCAKLLVYPGGRGGEFVGNLLNSHEECVHSYVIELPKNRYLLRFAEPIEIAPTHNSKQIFLISHYETHEHIPLNNFVDVYNSPRYHPFYFLLFCLKTLSQRFYFDANGGHCNLLTEQQRNDMATQMPNRKWHYEHEAEAWLESRPADSIRTHLIKYLKQYGLGGCVTREQINRPIIDLDQLNFGDTAGEYTRVCHAWGLTPIPNMVDTIKEYHAKNMALVDKYLNCKLDVLLSAYMPFAYDLILDAVDRRHNDPEN